MKHSAPITLCAALLAVGLRRARSTDPVPDALKPPADETLAMIVAARGVQIYECRARKDGAGVGVGLRRARRRPVRCARHADRPPRRRPLLAGPRRQPRRRQRQGARRRTESTGAIPWLLLTTKSTGPEGSFSKVTSIQRVNTVGGIAPRHRARAIRPARRHACLHGRLRLLRPALAAVRRPTNSTQPDSIHSRETP